jgi:Cu(I)/Ag(I) efflux system protein CusF
MKYNLVDWLAAAALAVGGIAVASPASATDRQVSGLPWHIAQASTLADGEIRKVDKDAKKITIRHGPIANLDMPSMTMVFQVKEPALLEGIKAGDKVRFAADRIGGAYVVTRIEPLK